MNLRSLAAVAAAAIALAGAGAGAGAAQAAVVMPTNVWFAPYGTALPNGHFLITNFDGSPAGDFSEITLAPGFTIGLNTAQLATGSASGDTAAPATSSSTHDTTQYLSIHGSQVTPGGQQFNLTTLPIIAFSLYSGSIDGWNHLRFTYADGDTTGDLNGSWVANNTIPLYPPAVGTDGNWDNATTNGRLIFTFAKPVVGVYLASDTNSFEISDLTAAGAVPEPGAWALMILGFGAAGAMLRNRRRAFA